MRGVINFYINFPADSKNIQETFQLVKNFNQEVFAKLREDGYYVTFIPSTNEACRVEKIDFDKPFPIFVNRQRTQLPDIQDTPKTEPPKETPK